MKQVERERVFLVKKLPANIGEFVPILISIGDFFDSNNKNALKIRQKGDDYHLIKKETNSVHERIENVIHIKKEEFDVLFGCTIQSHRKKRYIYPCGKYECEIDYYLGRLEGYVRVEVEFDNNDDMFKFTPPEWFGPEITEINHEIHEDLGIVTFDEMEKRYRQRKIILEKALLSEKVRLL